MNYYFNLRNICFILFLLAVPTLVQSLTTVRIQRRRSAFSHSKSRGLVNSIAVICALYSEEQNDSIDQNQPSMMESSTLQEKADGGILEINCTPDDDAFTLYNAAPLISGLLVTAVSLFLTAYAFYAGLSGTDPLFQAYPT
jgi:hypothetical protein